MKNGTLSKERMQSYQKLKTENDYMEHAKSYLEVAVKNMKQRNGCQKIMGPNPIKLEEELLSQCKIPKGQSYVTLAADRG